MTRTTRSSGKDSAMRAVGVLVCALSIVTTLAGVARSGGSTPCDPSSCPLNLTQVTNGSFVVGGVCLNPKDKKGLKAARQQCEGLGETCCLDGDLEACPTSKPSKPYNITYTCAVHSVLPATPKNITGIPGICLCQPCPLGQRLWYCQLEPD